MDVDIVAILVVGWYLVLDGDWGGLSGGGGCYYTCCVLFIGSL